MDFPEHFAARPYAFVLSLIFVFGFFHISSVQAASLHTFKQYAAMTEKQKTEVIANASSVVFKDALTRKDNQQVACLRKTLSLKYGPRKEVLSAHAILQKKIEIGIEIERKAGKQNSNKRVEYLIANHLQRICLPSIQGQIEYYYYGPPFKKVVPQTGLGVIDKSADLPGS